MTKIYHGLILMYHKTKNTVNTITLTIIYPCGKSPIHGVLIAIWYKHVVVPNSTRRRNFACHWASPREDRLALSFCEIFLDIYGYVLAISLSIYDILLTKTHSNDLSIMIYDSWFHYVLSSHSYT